MVDKNETTRRKYTPLNKRIRNNIKGSQLKLSHTVEKTLYKERGHEKLLKNI